MVIPVADALENAVAPAPLIVYVPDPVMDLVAVPVLANVALVTAYVKQASVPCVSVRAPLRVSAPAKVAVPVVLTISVGSVLPLLVMVPVPTIVGVKLVNVPPVDNVSPFKFNAVAATANAVEPKSNRLNQLAVVNVCIAVPLSVSDKLGALVAVPPVVPNTSVLVTEASVVNPPVPVYVKLVTMAILNTVVAAVVCVRLILAGYGLILLLVGRLPLVVVELYDELSVK
jgi:hypothetical protein